MEIAHLEEREGKSMEIDALLEVMKKRRSIRRISIWPHSHWVSGLSGSVATRCGVKR